MIDNRKKFTTERVKEKKLENRKLLNYKDDTLNSILGFGKLIYHPEKVMGVKQKTNAFPLTATLSLGNYCNHACLWCSTYYWQQESSKTIDFRKITKWIKKSSLKGLKSIIYVGNGEPLAYKRFPEITEFVYKNKLDQGIFTNGYLMNRYFDELSEYFTLQFKFPG